jgi:predicted amidohydrolase YtcJ
MLIARPNAMILYSTLAKGPKLPLEYQVNSTRQFMRELNRLGVTSASMPAAVIRITRTTIKSFSNWPRSNNSPFASPTTCSPKSPRKN